MKRNLDNIYLNVWPPSVVKSVFNARKLMNADISNHILLKDLAKCSGTNECTLKRAFKNIFKITVYQYLLRKRMKQARYLLQSTNLKEREIAILCGYESLGGFVTTFRRYFGFRPRHLRTRMSRKEGFRNSMTIIR
jgi:AraC-like DNA-binding protein